VNNYSGEELDQKSEHAYLSFPP